MGELPVRESLSELAMRNLPFTRAGRVMIHPRSAILVASSVAVIAGVAGLQYPAHYLRFPELWAGLVFAAGSFGFLAAITRRPLFVCGSGAALIGASMARAGATFIESQVTHREPAPIAWAYVIAATQWAGFAYFVWLIWIRLVVPWSAMRESPDDP